MVLTSSGVRTASRGTSVFIEVDRRRSHPGTACQVRGNHVLVPGRHGGRRRPGGLDQRPKFRHREHNCHGATVPHDIPAPEDGDTLELSAQIILCVARRDSLWHLAILAKLIIPYSTI